MDSRVWFDDVSHFTEVPRPVTGHEYLPSLYRGNAPMPLEAPSAASSLPAAAPRQGLSKGAIAGICVTVALVLVIALFLFWYFGVGDGWWPKRRGGGGRQEPRKAVADVAYFSDDDDEKEAPPSNEGPPLPEPEIKLADESDSSFVPEP